MGWILVTDGQSDKALPLLRDALSRDSNALTRYHIAVVLKALGRSNEARKELHVIINSNPDLKCMNDVRELLNELSS